MQFSIVNKSSTVFQKACKKKNTKHFLGFAGMGNILLYQVYDTRHAENLKTIVTKHFSVAWIIGTTYQKLSMIGHVGDQHVK